MPFWTLFWLIAPAVALLTAGVLLYRRNGTESSDAASDRRHPGAGPDERSSTAKRQGSAEQ